MAFDHAGDSGIDKPTIAGHNLDIPTNHRHDYEYFRSIPRHSRMCKDALR